MQPDSDTECRSVEHSIDDKDTEREREGHTHRGREKVGDDMRALKPKRLSRREEQVDREKKEKEAATTEKEKK